MTQVNDTITLTSADALYPQEPKDVYLVESGQVLVYIVPWENGKPKRRLLLCELGPKKMIPSFVYRDMDYKNWRFALVAKDEAVLTVKKNSLTSVLQQKFLRSAGINTFAQEGFDGSLAEYYRREILKDDAYISRGERAEPEAKQQAFRAIKDVFHNDTAQISGSGDTYRALAFLCEKMGITIVDQESLLARCGKDPSITDIARASHFICRKVVLDAGWYKHDCGGLIGKLEEKTVACIPGKGGKYMIFYPEEGKTEKLTAKVAREISPEAYSIGRTLPMKKLTKKDVFQFCKKSISGRDLIPTAVLLLVCALIGILLPTLNQMIYDDYIPLGDIGNLAQMCIVMMSFMVGNLFFSIVKNLFSLRIVSGVGNDLQNAVYHRLFHLPESFFRNYDSADLGRRVMTISNVASSTARTLILTSMNSVFSIVYLVRMISYSGKLTWIGLGMYVLYALFSLWITTLSKKQENLIAEAEGQSSSKLYQYLNGVDKIRMAGVEDRAMLSYMQPYTRQQTAEIRKNRLISVAEAVGCVISTIFSMVLYLIIVQSKLSLSVGSFIAFNTAFGAFVAALDGLLNEMMDLYQEKDAIERFWPIFEAKPEDDETKEVPGDLTGSIQLDHVTFAYEQGGKNVLNDMSLHIKAGEYVGIVGSSGCGKSTLLKMLLGFETPNSGMVMVDGKDLQSIDKSAYRKQLGVVLQNGKLISGSIYENITITAPNANMARVNQVIDAVGLRDDINQMPMGIHTVLSENCNTISGGQQQRILIARAIVGSPAILIFDEATSALDNITQAAVSSNLDKMKITRIVVAHRLSTIKNCDRILVLKDGSVAEEGNYESLMARKGLFYALASRQIAE